jgi:hypothetical protein
MLAAVTGSCLREGKEAIAMTESVPEPTTGCRAGCQTCADLRRAVVALAGSFGLEAVTGDRLAEVARIPAHALDAHACGAVDACVAAAYEEQIEGLQARFAARLRRGPTREDGLREATSDLLAYLARHPDVAAFVSVEVVKGGRELLELRERLRQRSVENVRRELARFDGAAVAPQLQIEMLVATMSHTIARHVHAGRTSELPDAIEPALAMASACEPLPARM